MMMKTLAWLLFQIYRLILELLYLLLFPVIYLVLRSNKYTEAISAKQPQAEILVHAASLGEINALAPLIKTLIEKGYQLAINTLTVSGKKRALELFPNVPVRLSPLDIRHLKRRQFAQAQVKLLLIAETEIWPNMLYSAQRQGVNVLFINARISESSLKRYILLKPILTVASKSVIKILAQSKADAERFARLFNVESKNLGNLKFAIQLPEYAEQDLIREFGWNTEDKILVWGSSRPGEEALLLNALPRLRSAVKPLRLIIAPRHPKRIRELEQLFKDEDYQLYSKLNPLVDKEIVIIDSLGVLTQAYAVAELAVVGGSFYDFGGHNPLEPAFYQKAILMGPYFQSCRDSVQALQAVGGIWLSSADNLANDMIFLLNNPDERAKMGEAAKKVLTNNAHSLDYHVMEIEKWL